MGRTKGSKNKQKSRPPGSGKKKLKIVGGQLPEAEIIEMAERAKNYRPIKAVYDGEKLPDTTIDEHPMYETVKPVLLNGPVFDQGKIQKRINDLTNHEVIETIDGVQELPPLKGVQPSSLAIDTEKLNVPPFPSNWNEMGKVQKLKWLTANHRK